MHLEKSSIEEAYEVKMTNEQWDIFKQRLKFAGKNCGDELFGDLIPDTIAKMRDEMNLRKLESSGSEKDEEEEAKIGKEQQASTYICNNVSNIM